MRPSCSVTAGGCEGGSVGVHWEPAASPTHQGCGRTAESARTKNGQPLWSAGHPAAYTSNELTGFLRKAAGLTKVVVFIGATLGGALGWWLGATLGVFTAFVLSIVGSGLGIYYSRRWVGKYLP